MRSQLSPSSPTAQVELQRLYVQRSAIDRLIEALNLYSRHASAAQVVPMRKGPRSIRRELAVRTGS